MVKTNKTGKTAKQANYERTFFTMILAAWVVLAVVFNVAQKQLPQEKPAAAKTAGAVHAAPTAGQVASAR